MWVHLLFLFKLHKNAVHRGWAQVHLQLVGRCLSSSRWHSCSFTFFNFLWFQEEEHCSNPFWSLHQLLVLFGLCYRKEKQSKGRFLQVHLPSQHYWLTSVPGHQLIWTAAEMHFRLTANVNKSCQVARVLGYHCLGKIGDDFASPWICRSQDP